MPAHTPGPWTAQELHANYKGWVVLYENGQGRRRVDGDKDGTFTEANARLIAAAPRMLDLLKHVPHNNMTATHRMVESVAGCPGCEARAILRDVEGESNG